MKNRCAFAHGRVAACAAILVAITASFVPLACGGDEGGGADPSVPPGDVPPGSEGGAGTDGALPPATGEDVNVAGTRLRPRYLVASGQRQFFGWQDGATQAECWGQSVFGSPTYCLPPAELDDKLPAFANGTCEASGRRERGAQLLHSIPLLQVCPTAKHVIIGDPATTAPYAMTPRLFEKGPASAQATACSFFDPAATPTCRAGASGQCYGLTETLGTEIPLASLASGPIVNEPITPDKKLGLARVAYADGTREFRGWHDGAEICNRATAADGFARCFPGRYLAKHYLDGLCQERALVLTGEGAEPPLPPFIEADEVDAAGCGAVRKIYGVAGRASARPPLIVDGKVRLFARNAAGECAPSAAASPDHVATLGPEIEAATRPELELVVAQGERLDVQYTQSSGAKVFDSWFDKTLGAKCTFAKIGDRYRCVPSERVVPDVGTSTGATYYADGGCVTTARLLKKPKTSTCTVPPLFASVSTACFQSLRLFRLGDPPAQLFESVSGTCKPATVNASEYWAETSEITIAELAEGKVEP